jgi:lipid-A-disaccharide synthase-like uncharacterized protein
MGGWEIVGYSGTAIFGTRFIAQWIASERAGRSVVPPAFWWLSIVGSALMLAYALHIAGDVGWGKGLPLVLAYAPNALIYARNIMLLEKEAAGRTERPAAEEARLVTPAPAPARSEAP